MTANVSASRAVARAIDILSDLVGFDTTSSNSNLALMRYIEALLGKHGIKAELLADGTGLKANLFATIGPPRAGGVILSAHTDVVPVADQQWTSDPFSLTRRGDRLYGRGTADMKSFIACSLAALEFAELDALERPVHVAFSYDEEVGCLGAPQLIANIHARIAVPAVVIVGEPSTMRIIGSHKGVHVYKVRVTGRPAHSSATHQGVSANALAIRLMSVLLRIADELAEQGKRDPDFQPPFSTLTIGLMKGGTAANILAAEASFVFDLRLLPQQDAGEILQPFYAEIDSLLRTAHMATTISVEQLAAVPPLVRVLDCKAEALVRMIGRDASDVMTAAYGAEAGQFQQSGLATVICGPGSMDQGHQPDEFIEISEIEKCMEFLGNLFAVMSRPGALE